MWWIPLVYLILCCVRLWGRKPVISSLIWLAPCLHVLGWGLFFAKYQVLSPLSLLWGVLAIVGCVLSFVLDRKQDFPELSAAALFVGAITALFWWFSLDHQPGTLELWPLASEVFFYAGLAALSLAGLVAIRLCFGDAVEKEAMLENIRRVHLIATLCFAVVVLVQLVLGWLGTFFQVSALFCFACTAVFLFVPSTRFRFEQAGASPVLAPAWPLLFWSWFAALAVWGGSLVALVLAV